MLFVERLFTKKRSLKQSCHFEKFVADVGKLFYDISERSNLSLKNTIQHDTYVIIYIVKCWILSKC